MQGVIFSLLQYRYNVLLSRLRIFYHQVVRFFPFDPQDYRQQRTKLQRPIFQSFFQDTKF